ncbi:MAG: hypothetical protein OXT09_14695, partial [Myxococcales bacterium]|nr:hypothetical protein [Myxococcales bacterium]
DMPPAAMDGADPPGGTGDPAMDPADMEAPPPTPEQPSPTPDDPAAVAPNFETLTFIINQAPCFGAGCPNDDQNKLDLRVDDGLVGRLTSQVSTNCGDMPIVSPGAPEQSALIRILKEACGTTPRMPLGCVDDNDGGCVPPEYIAAIEQWIADGAAEP